MLSRVAHFPIIVWRWTKRSIQRKLILWATLFWVISVSILSLTLIFTGQSRMVREANDRNTQMASVISRDINARMSGISSDLRTFAVHLENVSSNVTAQADALMSLRLTNPLRYREAYYFDSQGNLLFYLTDTLQELLSIHAADVVSRPAISVSDPVLSTFGQVHGNTYVSGVGFTEIERAPVIYVGMPIRTEMSGNMILVLQVDLSDIWRSIDLATMGQTGLAYMVSSDGTIIAHPQRAYIGRPMSPELMPVLSGIEDHTQYIEPFRKEPVLASYSPVGGQNGWGIVVQQDRSEAYASINGTIGFSVAVWSILAAIGAVGISISLRNFARPIINLTKTAQYIARTGELTRTSMSQNPDEVGQLSQAFDGMISKLESAEEDLRRAHGELENRVILRTAELSEANTLLKSEINQRAQIEQALRDNELKYRHLVQSATTMILEMDPEGRVTFVNQFAEQFFGFKESEILGKNVVGTIVPARDSAGKDLEAMISDIVANPERYRHNENENIRKNGQRVWVVWSNQPLYDEDGKLSRVLCVGIDMTEQKKIEEIAAQRTREQAAIAERTRLARDLHDAVSQTLFSASIVAEVLPRIWDKNPEEGRRRLQEVRELTRGALAEMRTLLFELRPAALIDVDLCDLLKQLAESITGGARVPVSAELEGECCLSPEVKVALYRIAQEALNNVAKHSGATQAYVLGQQSDGRVELRIRDNGHGFDESRVKPNSLGLGIMRERAQAIGASLEIRGAEGGGTEVIVIWEIPSKEDTDV